MCKGERGRGCEVRVSGREQAQPCPPTPHTHTYTLSVFQTLSSHVSLTVKPRPSPSTRPFVTHSHIGSFISKHNKTQIDLYSIHVFILYHSGQHESPTFITLSSSPDPWIYIGVARFCYWRPIAASSPSADIAIL